MSYFQLTLGSLHPPYVFHGAIWPYPVPVLWLHSTQFSGPGGGGGGGV